jgi:hypothetical protein
LLFGDRPSPGEVEKARREAVHRLVQDLHENKVLNRVLEDVEANLSTGMEAILRQALGQRIVDLFLDQVRGWERLREARDASLDDPDGRHEVVLTEPGWQVKYVPSITFRVDGQLVLTLAAKAEVIFRAGRLTAVIQAGRLVGLDAGSLGVAGKLWIQGELVAERTCELPVTVVLDLAGGIPLGSAADESIDLRPRRRPRSLESTSEPDRPPMVDFDR